MWKRLAVILGVGLLLRALFLWLYVQRFPFLETPLAGAALWSELARQWSATGLPEGPFFEAPGYPLFLAALGNLWRGPMAMAIAQLLLGLATTALTALVARRLFGAREALLSAGILTLSAAPYFLEVRSLESTLAATLAVAFAWLLLVADQGLPAPMNAEEELAGRRARADGFRPPPARGWPLRAAPVAGVVAGLLATVRGVFLLSAFLVLAALVSRAIQSRRPWNSTLLFAAGLALALAPLGLHNGWYGAPSPLPVGAGFHFFESCERGSGPLPASHPDPEARADSLMKADLGQVLDPGPESGYWVTRALAELSADPALGWRREGERLRILVGRYEEEPGASLPLETLRIAPRRLTALPANFLIAAGVLGLLLAAGRMGASRGARLSLLGPVSLTLSIGVAGLLFAPGSSARYPALPLLAVGAAHALTRADEAWRKGKRRSLMVLGGVCLVFVAATWNSPLGPWRRPAEEARLFAAAGSIREAAGGDDSASELYRQALAIDPGQVDASVRLSQIALRRRDLAGAIRPLEKARGAAPDDFVVRNNLGLLYLQAQRLPEADRELQAAISLRPGEAGPWYYRGQIARADGDSAGALRYYEEAIQRDGRFLPAWGRLIDLLIDLGRPEEARIWADRAGEAGMALPADLASRLRAAESGRP